MSKNRKVEIQFVHPHAVGSEVLAQVTLRDDHPEDGVLALSLLENDGTHVTSRYVALFLPNPKEVTISENEFERFVDAYEWKSCLECGGVDNWEGYHDSLRVGGYFKDEEEE